MMWETYPVSDPEDRWFHFNYMNGINPYGLNKAAVFDSGNLEAIFDLFLQKTGHRPFGGSVYFFASGCSSSSVTPRALALSMYTY